MVVCLLLGRLSESVVKSVLVVLVEFSPRSSDVNLTLSRSVLSFSNRLYDLQRQVDEVYLQW